MFLYLYLPEYKQAKIQRKKINPVIKNNKNNIEHIKQKVVKTETFLSFV